MTAAVVEAMVVLLISLVVAGYLCGVRPHLARRRQRDEEDLRFWARLRQDTSYERERTHRPV